MSYFYLFVRNADDKFIVKYAASHASSKSSLLTGHVWKKY